MHAVVTQVKIADFDKAQPALHSQVIPGVKQQAGFVRGVWLADRAAGRGIGVAVFDSEKNAQAAHQALRSGDGPPPPEGVTIENTGVWEVVGEA